MMPRSSDFILRLAFALLAGSMLYACNLATSYETDNPAANNDEAVDVDTAQQVGGTTPETALAVAEGNDTEVNEAPSLVAVYEGVLPAASAEGIQHTISFYDDNTFHLVRIYLGRPESMNNTFEDQGPYEVVTGYEGDPEATRYVLHPKDEFNKIGFLKVDETTLLMLDREQRIVESDLNYYLTRVGP